MGRFLSVRALALAMGAAACSMAVANTVITFEELGVQPGFFNSTSPLTNQYFGTHGVTFSGPSPVNGGAILNQSGNFGVNAFSGQHFLAFNRANSAGVQMQNGGFPNDPEDITFSTPIASFSIMCGGLLARDYVLAAFKPDNTFIGNATANGVAGQWVQLSFSSNMPIGRVQLRATATAQADYFVYDDMTYKIVPEPGTMAVLGFGALAMLRKLRRK